MGRGHGHSRVVFKRPVLDRGLRRAQKPIPVRQERLIAMIQLMTSSLSERARSLEAGVQMVLGNSEYEENLIDMLVGILEAPVGN